MRVGAGLLTSVVTLTAGVVVGGPISSGGWLLLLPTLTPSVDHPLPSSHEQLHNGQIDVSSGLYIRRDDDLVLAGTPPFVLTRTYRSQDPVARQFGVGTTHNGEWYLTGDSDRFQWARLILENSARIHFDRLSPGVLFVNAMFEHRPSPTLFDGARLGWVGLAWALKWQDGRLAIFRSCGPAVSDMCSITWLRDQDGHWTHFARDSSGLLRQIVTRLQRIDFDYDTERRVTRAIATNGRSVFYTYDDRSRLIRTYTSEGVIRSYTYGPNGEMLTIREPGVFIENTYDDARCVRQVTHLRDPDGTERVRRLRVDYTVRHDAVMATDVIENESSRRRYEFREGFQLSESFDDGRGNLALVTLKRDPETHAVASVTVQCTGSGRLVTQTAQATGIDPELVKASLLAQSCSWFAAQTPRALSALPYLR
jgi:YD repeat-containing protein